MKKNAVYLILFSILMVFLFLPIFRLKVKPLYGVFEKTMKPTLTMESYTSGKFQANIEKYISENYGFRDVTIRVYNQYLWSCYRKTYVDYVVLGKNDWLFFKQNVNEYYGTEMHRWFDSTEEARETYERKTRIMYKLQRVLKEQGIDLLIFTVPEKGLLYSQYLPEREFDTTTLNANKFYTEKFKEYGVPFISTTDWFKQIQDTASFPLISKYGIHWNYSCVYAADSLFRYLGDMKGIQLPRIKTSNFHKYTKKEYKKHYIDFDVEETLNLVFPINHDGTELYAGDVEIISDSNSVKPRVLFVGNSFLWRIRDFIPLNEVFTDPMFWYYNSTVYYGKNLKSGCPIHKISTILEILKSDYIVYITSEHSLYKLSYGFAEKALVDLCVPKEIMDREMKRISDSLGIPSNEAKRMILKNPELIPELRGDSVPTIRNDYVLKGKTTAIKMIEKDSKWVNTLKKHAKYRGKTLIFMKDLEADNIINNRVLFRDIDPKIGDSLFQKKVDEMVSSWKKDPNTVKTMTEKAESRKITLEKMYRLDAIWVIDNYPEKYHNKIYDITSDN